MSRFWLPADGAGSTQWLCSGHRDKNVAIFDIYVGIVNLLRATEHTQWLEVNQVILHPEYERLHPVGGDVALVQLKSPIVFSDSVLPVCVAPPDLNLTALSCWVTGWGMVSQQGRHRALALTPAASSPRGAVFLAG